MSSVQDNAAAEMLRGRRIALVGKMGGMPKRELQQLIRSRGGVIAEHLDATLDLIVVGEEELPQTAGLIEESFDAEMRQAIERRTLEIVTETQLWQRLGLVEGEQNIHRLYTPAMLADLLGVPISVIRRWHRRGLVVPVREVRRLPYFDFQEVSTARRLAELLAAGVSPAAIEKKLAALARFVPGVDRPLAQLSVIVEGKQLLLRQGDGLIEPGGQWRLDFEHAADETRSAEINLPIRQEVLPLELDRMPATPQEMLSLAGQLEDEGHLDAAADMYRACLAAAGPDPEICFLLAELLYQAGDVAAARERYYMAIELDEDYVEARANLGCVLAETGQLELAVAAFTGALTYHGDYADVHYHLARTLDDLCRGDEAQRHWQEFVRLAPNSPWAEEARQRLRDEGE